LKNLKIASSFNPLVGGSSPPRPTKNKKIKSLALLGFFASAAMGALGAGRVRCATVGRIDLRNSFFIERSISLGLVRVFLQVDS
jgi:hypothetical protein